MSLRTVIVTGGAGFIGSHLVNELVEQGMRVFVLDDLTSGSEENVHPDAEFVYCDVSNPHQVHAVFELMEPEIVFHNAVSKCMTCTSDPRRDWEVNAGGTLNLLEASREFGVKKFIYASTGSVYGNAVYTPMDRNHPTNPLTYYGVSKLAGEKYVGMFHRRGWLDVAILRYFHVYGSRQRDADGAGGVVGIFCRRALQGLPLVIYGDGAQVRCFTYVGDVVRANLLMLENTGVYNCVSSERVSVIGLAEEVIELAGQGEMEFTDARPGEIREFRLEQSRLTRLGIEWTEFDKGLVRTFEWYRERYGENFGS